MFYFVHIEFKHPLFSHIIWWVKLTWRLFVNFWIFWTIADKTRITLAPIINNYALDFGSKIHVALIDVDHDTFGQIAFFSKSTNRAKIFMKLQLNWISNWIHLSSNQKMFTKILKYQVKKKNVDMLATIWHEIVSWFLMISQDLRWFAKHDQWIVFVLIFISVQNNFMITTNKNWEKRGKTHKSTNNAMSNDGSSIKKIYRSHGDWAVSPHFCKFYRTIFAQNQLSLWYEIECSVHL